MPRSRVRALNDLELLHLVRLAAGLLQDTDGDVVEAMRLALRKHFDLIRAIHEREIASDFGPGNAILFVPEGGGLAIRLERHPAMDETEEAEYPEIDLFDFEVYEPPSKHKMVAPTDVTTLEGWED